MFEEDFLKDRSSIRCKKAGCHQQIDFHKKNVIVQTVLSSFFILASIFYAQKKDPMLPFFLIPSATISLKKLIDHKKKLTRFQKELVSLEGGAPKWQIQEKTR